MQKKSVNPTVQVLEAYRAEGKVKQRLIASLGVIKNNEDCERLIKMAHVLIAKLTAEKNANNPQISLFKKMDPVDFDAQKKKKSRSSKGEVPVYPSDLTHIRNENSGFTEVFSKLSEQLGFDAILKEADNAGKHTFNVCEIIKSIFIQSIQEPASKRLSFWNSLQEKGQLSFEL
jgi:hypothetical protein